MPSHCYEPVPLEDEDCCPSTAPPSFHTLDLSLPPSQSQSQPLPHRNDETATTFIPPNQRVPRPQSVLSNGSEHGGDIWTLSETNHDSELEGEEEEEEEEELNPARDEVLVQLMNRVETLEQHFARMAMIGKQDIEIDLEAARQKAEKRKWWSEFWTTVGVTLFLFWLGAALGAAIVLPGLRDWGGGSS